MIEKILNNPNLEIVNVKDWGRKEWLAYRDTGIGASEVGTILGYSQWDSPINVFYRKLGVLPEKNQTPAMFMGRYFEDPIANLWQYWETDMEQTMINYDNKVMVRKAIPVDCYIRNKKYPWLFVSLDRLMATLEGEILGALEIKDIAKYYAEQWIGDMPPAYVVQVQTQLLVCELDKGEIAVLFKSDNDFNVIPFSYSEKVGDLILTKTKDFWGRIVESRKLLKGKKPFEHLEPEPDDSMAYEQFIKEQYRGKPITQEGTATQLSYARKLNFIGERKKELEKTAQGLKNNLLKTLKDVEVLTFGASGKVTFKKDKNGTFRFNNSVDGVEKC